MLAAPLGTQGLRDLVYSGCWVHVCSVGEGSMKGKQRVGVGGERRTET